MDNKTRNHQSKRFFGRDITNIERRHKNNSIYEKAVSTTDFRQKSKSYDKKPQLQTKDPIHQYQQQIFKYILKIHSPEKQEKQTHVNEDMRLILIDWIVDVHQSFQLKEQTLYLALYYLNQYSSFVDLGKHEYQLAGITCLWIASKYEEIYPPRMSAYVQVTDSTYSLNQLKEMQGKIMLALNFNLNYTTFLSVLNTISEKWPKGFDGKKNKQSQKTYNMCKYLLQMSMFQGLSKTYCLKTLIVSSLMLSDSIFRVKTESKTLENVDKDSLTKCFKDMCLALQSISRTSYKLKAIRKKYSQEKYLCVAKFRIEQKS